MNKVRKPYGDMESHFLHSLMEHFSDRIFFKDLQSRILYGNRSYLQLFHQDQLSDIVGKMDSDFFSDYHAKTALADEQEIIRTGESKLNMQEMETWPDGSITWSSTSKAPLKDDNGGIIGTLGISRDITSEKLTQEALRDSESRYRQISEELASANRRLEELSFKDPLTQLWNRRYLVDQLPVDIAVVDRAHRNVSENAIERMKNNVDLLFLMVDLDHFKEVNDQHGHKAGDLVLQQVAELLHRVSRDSDMVTRIGGEEFLVVARQVARIDSYLLAERIRAAVEAFPFSTGTSTIRCTCSVGFSVYPPFLSEINFFNWEQVVEIADQCLYAAKNNGRNAWVGIIPDQSAPNLDRSTLPKDISQLVRSGLLPTMSSLGKPVVWV
jgi:diguanylate cyclase (GGDEF)-like protein/PAS domain S-box-containing protein